MPKLLPIHAYIYIYIVCMYMYMMICAGCFYCMILAHYTYVWYSILLHLQTYVYIYMYVSYSILLHLPTYTYIYICLNIYLYVHIYIPVYDYIYRVLWLHAAWTIVYHDRAGLNGLEIDIDSVCFNPYEPLVIALLIGYYRGLYYPAFVELFYSTTRIL